MTCQDRHHFSARVLKADDLGESVKGAVLSSVRLANGHQCIAVSAMYRAGMLVDAESSVEACLYTTEFNDIYHTRERGSGMEKTIVRI